MKRISSLIFLLTAAFFVLSTSILPVKAYAARQAGGITVSAAISLKNAFEEMGRLFEAQYGGARVFFNFAASGDLARQIEQGAPVDVFASAAEKEMNELEKEGLIMPGSRADFAGNTIVLVTPAGSRIGIKNFGDLARPEIKRIAAGNPATVPAGRYAMEVFQYYKLLPAISPKLVYGEHVREVLSYVQRGEVDAGVVYSTDAAIMAGQVGVACVAPPASHRPILYPVAAIKSSENKRLALAFISLLKSAQGRSILEKYGFRMVSR